VLTIGVCTVWRLRASKHTNLVFGPRWNHYVAFLLHVVPELGGSCELLVGAFVV